MVLMIMQRLFQCDLSLRPRTQQWNSFFNKKILNLNEKTKKWNIFSHYLFFSAYFIHFLLFLYT